MEQEALQIALAEALKAENFGGVEKLAREAVETYEDAAWGYYFLGEAFLQQADYERAEICLAKAIELDENNDDYRLRFAANKEAQELWEDACIVYAIILENNPNNLHALLGLAKIFLEVEKDGEQALEYILRAEAIVGWRAIVQMFKARALAEMEDFEGALAALENIFDKADVEEAHLLKISLLSRMESGDDSATIAAYEHLCDVFGKESPIHLLNFASFLMERAHWVAAEKQLGAYLATKGGFDAVATELLGVVLSEQGKHAEAIAAFTQIIEAMPEDWTAYSKRANAHLSAADPKSALADLQTAAKYVSPASKSELSLHQARLQLRANQLKEAFALFSALSKDETYAADGYFGMAQVFQKSNTNPDKAFEALQKAVQLGHKEAAAFTTKHYAAQFAAAEAKTLGDYAQFSTQNSQSAALQPLFGKIWRYSPALNAFDDLPAELAKRFHQNLLETTLVLTAEGILVCSPLEKKALAGVYKIEKEAPQAVQIQIQPLDGSRPYSAQISPKGGHLVFKQVGGEAAVLKELPLSAFVGEEQKMLRRYLTAENTAFLGEQAASLRALL